MDEFAYKNKRRRHKPSAPAYKISAGESDDEPFIPLHKLKSKQKDVDDPYTYKVLRATKKRLGLIIIIVLTLLVGLFAYKYFTTNSELKKANDFTNNSEELAKAIQEEVSKYVTDLPKETPKLDTINDPTASGGSILFKDTQKGDKVLYYESAGKALIYRPSTKQIVVYTYVTANQPSEEEQSALPDSNSSENNDGGGTTVPGTVIPTQNNE